MRDRKLASRYARALLGAVREPQEREAVDGFLQTLAQAIDLSDDLRASLFDPAVPRPSRVESLRTLATTARMPETIANFLAMLVERNRLTVLTSIAQVFHELREREAGIVPAEVTTATPLSTELRERVQAALEKASGTRVRLVCTVQPSILGGATARVGSYVYDGSLRTQLARLRKKMADDDTAREAR